MKLNVIELAKQQFGADFTEDRWYERHNETMLENIRSYTSAVLEEAAKKCLQGDNEYKNGIECAAAIKGMKQ